MSGEDNPWEMILPSENLETVNTRRADHENPHNFFWGRDHEGRYTFLFNSGYPIGPQAGTPRLAGIRISLENEVDGGHLRLRLTLGDNEQVDIFRTICRDLMRAAAAIPADRPEQAVAVILARLRRWQDLLKPSSRKGLTPQQQLGLFGELLFLKEFFIKRLVVREAVACWRGPFGAEQDFGTGGWLLEVKSQLTTSDQCLSVSSASQLDSVSGNIAVCHQTFSSAPRSDTETSTLRSFVKDLVAEVSSADAIASDLFHAGLLEVGYSDIEEYDQLVFLPQKRNLFRVAPEFPRLEASRLPAGLRDVRYRVDMSAITDFLISEETLVQEMFG